MLLHYFISFSKQPNDLDAVIMIHFVDETAQVPRGYTHGLGPHN